MSLFRPTVGPPAKRHGMAIRWRGDSKVRKGQISRIDTIKHHNWSRIPMGKWQLHNESQEVSSFQASDQKRARKHNKNKTEIT